MEALKFVDPSNVSRNSWGVLRRALLPGWPLSWLAEGLSMRSSRVGIFLAIGRFMLAGAFSVNKSHRQSVKHPKFSKFTSCSGELFRTRVIKTFKPCRTGSKHFPYFWVPVYYLVELEPFCQWWTAAFDQTFRFGGVTEFANQAFMVPSTSSALVTHLGLHPGRWCSRFRNNAFCCLLLQDYD